jgi:hypothetical protein
MCEREEGGLCVERLTVASCWLLRRPLIVVGSH